MLQITYNPNLGVIDGLSGLQMIEQLVDIRGNGNLCFILNESPDEAYWRANVSSLLDQEL